MHKPMHLSSCGWRCCTTTVTHAQTVSPHMAFKPDVPSSWLTFVTVYFSAALSQHHLLLSHLLLPLLPVWPPRSCQLLLQQPAGFQLQVRTKTYPESSGLSVILQSEKQIFFFFYRTDENNSSTNQESALSPQGGASGEARRYQKKNTSLKYFGRFDTFFSSVGSSRSLCGPPPQTDLYSPRALLDAALQSTGEGVPCWSDLWHCNNPDPARARQFGLSGPSGRAPGTQVRQDLWPHRWPHFTDS